MKTLSIGRDASNNIVLNDKMVSRNHAQLIINEDGRVLIKDLGSTNGTFVNGNKIKESYLNPGDIVKCSSLFFDWKLYVNPVEKESEKASSNTYYHSDKNVSRDSNKRENKLFISSSISDSLPAMVKNELATLSAQKQQEFVEEYNRKKKSVGIAYLFLIIVLAMHYGYIRKWGLQLVFWFTGGGIFVDRKSVV